MQLRATRLTAIAHAVRRAIASFSPASLFAANEPGVWYDPSDIDRYMATGPELISNGTFDSSVDGWLTIDASRCTVGWEDGQLKGVVSAAASGAVFTLSLVPGRSYLLEGSLRTLAGASVGLRILNNAGAFVASSSDTTSSTLNRISILWTCTEAAERVYIRCSTNSATFYADNISVKELTAISTATMYQDSAGTTPVTAVEQPVGLILDKSRGLVLGPELVVNGDFSSGGANWTLKTGATISGGTLNISATGDIFAIAAQNIGISSANKWYRIRVTCSNYVSGVAFVALGDAGLLTRLQISANGTYEALFFYSNFNSGIDIRAFGPGGAGTTQLSLDNISVRELPGNHASQTTATSRPVLSARKNFYVNTETLATQNVTTRATKYIVSFFGTGSVTLSGTATGTLTGTGVADRVYLEFTATAGTLTSTVSGSVLKAQLEEV